VITLEAKNMELKIQRFLVDINRGEEDDRLFNKRQLRETVRQLRKSRKLRQLKDNPEN
jgi:predicted N-formylglutamate amidohydrolase